ncbi:hypothetical protein PGIGA_G00058230 [Pangasianodon gigas]|uniref:Uncharacterized protein n=1 Tax=Pangasianodon gigas TaxID=30993 RepID=A0ACC5X492_PANGG|nr:hypothetical protein [Pangasianodon gigas]
MMLRLLLLALLLTVKADKSDRDGSGDGFQDDDEEQGDDQEIQFGQHASVKNDREDVDNEEGNTTFIIIAAVSVVALTIVAIIAVVLFRRHLKRREQGVYSVPVEQGQKGV